MFAFTSDSASDRRAGPRRHRAGAVAGAALAAGVLATVLIAQPSAEATEPTAAAPAADRTLRVYNNNIENLVWNDGRDDSDGDDKCTRISGKDHLRSMLVDDDGRTGTSAVKAPDLLIVQQLRGSGQAKAYADQLSAKFGYPAGTYRSMVVWSDPAEWGGEHRCATKRFGNLKKQQTNGIVYNTKRLRLVDTAKYWSAGWYDDDDRPYADGKGCRLYKPPHADSGASLEKWRRTSALAAKFAIKETGTTVFAATMHLPQENAKHPCAGDGDKGLAGSGIRLGADATRLMNSSTVRVVGIDANRERVPRDVLARHGMTGYGAKATNGKRKIDYLFVKGSVRPSKVDHTVSGTKSNHKALYGFIPF